MTSEYREIFWETWYTVEDDFSHELLLDIWEGKLIKIYVWEVTVVSYAL